MKHPISGIAFALLSLAATASQAATRNEPIRMPLPGVHAPLDAEHAHGFVLPQATPVNGLAYNGGPLLNSSAGTNIYVIWYGNWTGSTTTSIIPTFLQHLGGSPYFNINTLYKDSRGIPVTNAVNYKGSTTDAYSQGTNLNDGQISSVVNSAIASGRLPKDTNAVYLVLTSSDVGESTGFCSSYCGWHTHNSIQSADIKYAFIGDPAHCSNAACAGTGISPNGNAPADTMVSVIAHEIEEAVTDPDLNAYINPGNQENADLCAWQWGTTHSAPNGAQYNQLLGSNYYLIQMNWLWANGGSCAQSYVTPPPPQSLLSSNPPSIDFGRIWPTYVTGTVQITNNGPTTATNLTYSITGQYGAPTGTCGTSLASHASCTLTFVDSAIPYSCTGDINFHGTVTVNGTNINIPLVVMFQGVAEEPTNWCR